MSFGRGGQRFRAWIEADVGIDTVLAMLVGIGALGLSFVEQAWRLNLSHGILNDLSWPTYTQNLAGVSANLLAMSATGIAVVLALTGGVKGQRVLVMAGPDLYRLLTRCFSSIAGVVLTLSMLGGLRPSMFSLELGVTFAFAMTLLSLRMLRLGYLFLRLIEVFILDSAMFQTVDKR